MIPTPFQTTIHDIPPEVFVCVAEELAREEGGLRPEFIVGCRRITKRAWGQLLYHQACKYLKLKETDSHRADFVQRSLALCSEPGKDRYLSITTDENPAGPAPGWVLEAIPLFQHVELVTADAHWLSTALERANSLKTISVRLPGAFTSVKFHPYGALRSVALSNAAIDPSGAITAALRNITFLELSDYAYVDNSRIPSATDIINVLSATPRLQHLVLVNWGEWDQDSGLPYWFEPNGDPEVDPHDRPAYGWSNGTWAKPDAAGAVQDVQLPELQTFNIELIPCPSARAIISSIKAPSLKELLLDLSVLPQQEPLPFEADLVATSLDIMTRNDSDVKVKIMEGNKVLVGTDLSGYDTWHWSFPVEAVATAQINRLLLDLHAEMTRRGCNLALEWNPGQDAVQEGLVGLQVRDQLQNVVEITTSFKTADVILNWTRHSFPNLHKLVIHDSVLPPSLIHYILKPRVEGFGAQPGPTVSITFSTELPHTEELKITFPTTVALDGIIGMQQRWPGDGFDSTTVEW